MIKLQSRGIAESDGDSSLRLPINIESSDLLTLHLLRFNSLTLETLNQAIWV